MDAGLPVDIGALQTAHISDQAQGLAQDANEDAGEKLEALFATMLVRELRRALPNEGFFGGGKGADVFNGWMDDLLGQQLADDGALDLAGRVKVALSQQQEEQDDA